MRLLVRFFSTNRRFQLAIKIDYNQNSIRPRPACNMVPIMLKCKPSGNVDRRLESAIQKGSSIWLCSSSSSTLPYRSRRARSGFGGSHSSYDVQIKKAYFGNLAKPQRNRRLRRVVALYRTTFWLSSLRKSWFPHVMHRIAKTRTFIDVVVSDEQQHCRSGQRRSNNQARGVPFMLMSRSVQTPIYTIGEETGEQDVRNAGWHEKRQGLGCVSEALSSECAARSEVEEVMKMSESDKRAANRKWPGGVATRSAAGGREQACRRGRRGAVGRLSATGKEQEVCLAA